MMNCCKLWGYRLARQSLRRIRKNSATWRISVPLIGCNGVEELSDFEAGDGNLLDSVPTPDPQIGQLLTFDVTSFVTEMVNAQEQWVGLTVRAETFGGLWVTEGGVYPKLTIETETEPEPCVGDIDGDGDTDHSDLGELLAAWCTHAGDPNWNPNADLDDDGHVGHGDLGILLADWGCTP